jgi:hypothetical protein
MISQQLTEHGFMKPAKAGGFGESMFLGHDHQKEQIIDACLLKARPHGDATYNPGLSSLCLHGASSGIVVESGWVAITIQATG